MTRLIMQDELENLSNMELRSTFNQIVNKLALDPQQTLEFCLLIASLQNVEREFNRRLYLKNI